jgi:organic radical activating enzyme
MANVLITDYCNRACSYCFARNEISPCSGSSTPKTHEETSMSLEDLDRVIRFFHRSEMSTMRILGGEPTIHPRFPQIIDKVLDAGFEIRIFTGGLIPPKIKKYIKTLDASKVMLIMNMSCPSETSAPGELNRITQNVYELAHYCTLGYTIYKPDFDATFLVDLATQSQCQPRIRLGIGVPQIKAENARIDPQQYPLVAKNILRLVRQSDSNNVAVEFDCGFPFCMFTPEELGYLITWGCKTNFVCSPTIDISPTLEVWPCFALSSMYRERLDKFETRQELVAYFAHKSKPYRTFGLYDLCHACKHKKRGQCAGGCLSHTIRSFA